MNTCNNGSASPMAGALGSAAGAAKNNSSLPLITRTKPGRWLRAIGAVAALTILPFSSCEAMYKCKQANDSYAYQDSPCAESTKAQPVNDSTLKAENPNPSASTETANQEPRANTLTPGQPVNMQDMPNPVPSTSQNINTDESGKNVPTLSDKNRPGRGTEYIAFIVGLLVMYLYFRWMVSVARRARENGRSFITWFVISSHITPLIAGAILTALDGQE